MSPRYCRTLVLALSLGHAAIAGAQQANAVEIRPTNLTSLDVAPYSTNTQRFWIVNTGTQTNQYSIFANTVTVGSTSAGYTRYDGERVLRYDSLTGRVRAMVSATRQDSVRYDAAGNAELTYYPAPTPSGMDDDRAVYYDALGRVRAVDHRIANGSSGLSQMLFTFEEFRYDALGRRVLARTRRFCRFLESVDCGHETIRRTIWDGVQELAEIQMPGGDSVSNATLENDTLPLANRGGVPGENGEYKDLNVFFGRVAYTHGVGLDRPLSVVRFDYADSVVNRPFVRWAPLSLVPHWNVRGEADNGSFSDGSLTKCTTVGGFTRCVQVRWPFGWTATAQQAFTRDLWHGSLLEDKRDGSGLLFRRNRYMDPATGRFTQEDPIGLAGGLNLYGFAGGDPVSYSDPFGLCPPAWLCDLVVLVSSQMARPNAVPALREFTGSFALGNSLGWNGACEGPGCKMGQIFGIAGMVLPTSQIHHIATNKNWISTRGGGPWSPKFADLFERAGMSLDDALNKIAVAGHRGPHPAYNQAVYDRLVSAVEGLEGEAYNAALRTELNVISRESATRGTVLNRLLTERRP